MNLTPLSNLLDTHTAYSTRTHWLIPDLLPTGLTILHGAPRIGKSWLTLHLALSVASGTPALGRLPTACASVLYLGLQDTPHHFAGRAHTLLGTQSAPDTFLYTDALLPLPSASNPLDALDQWLTTHPHTSLVVIDSLPHFASHCSSADNPALPIPVLLKRLRAIAATHRIAILVTNPCTNTSKRHTCNDHLADPTLTLADTLMLLTRERGQTDATLSLTGTTIPEQDLALRLPSDTLTWTLLGPALDHHLSQERQDILAILEEHRNGPLRPKDIAALLHKDRRTITKLLFDMSRSDQVRLVGRGHYMTAKNPTSQDTFATQEHATFMEKIHHIFDGKYRNIRNDGNQSHSTPSDTRNIGNDGNHLDSTPTESVGETLAVSLLSQQNIGNDGNHSHTLSDSIRNDGNHCDNGNGQEFGNDDKPHTNVR